MDNASIRDTAKALFGLPSREQAGIPCPPIKQMVDSVGSAVGLVLLAPVFAVFSLLIRLDSPGPILYRQTRVGRSGEYFTMFKFRTMLDGNDSTIHERYVQKLIRDGGGELRNGEGAFKLENDSRITRMGRWLRATSLDELPQLINVLRGEMSLVGPRPALPYEVELYTMHHARRLAVLPGITGLWQVGGRNETTFEEMVNLDVTYIEKWSILLDLKILLRTVSVVLSRRGA
jgi:lipopolysaccharide/colanic/teichoic acid biosynthesis glycosyltransferase